MPDRSVASGVMSVPRPARRPHPPAQPPLLPSRVDPAVRAASEAVGGPWGRHGVVGQRWFWTPLRVLLALTIFTLLLGWLEKEPCQNGNWQHSLQYTHFCYSDVVPLFFEEKLNVGATPYVDHAVEYPVLTGAFMGVAAWLGRQYDHLAGGVLPTMPPVQTYFTVTALLLAGCMLVVTWSTAALARRRIWDAAMVALCPLLILHAYTNWDLFAIALAGAALVAWQRRRPGVAGVLLGLGTAAKLYPGLFLIPLLALCLRTRRLGAFAWTFAGAALAWVAVNLPVAALYPAAWRRLPQLLFLTVAGFLLTNKVWSPQYSLWLVPLAVLARPSWRAYLIWQATECVLWVPRLLWFLGTGSKGVDFQWFLLAVLVRDVALVGYCVLVIRDILRPERDIVRASGDDDPAGGVLDRAPDREYPAGSWLRPRSASSTSPAPLGGDGIDVDRTDVDRAAEVDATRSASGETRNTT